MIFRLWLAVALIVAVVGLIHSSAVAADSWTVPDIDTLPDDADGKLVRLGRELTVATYAHIGPRVADKSERYAGNNLSCQSCHLEAGTKRYGLPFVGVFGDFPQYRAREGRVGTLEDRVNGCMTRSMNGRALPDDSTEMRAFVAYIRFLSSGGKQEIRCMARRSMPISASPATDPTGKANGYRARQPATSSRRSGAATASMTAPG
jgi:thiosulfate dehydrogenase